MGGVDGWCGWVVWMGGVDGWCGWVVWMGGVDGWCRWVVWMGGVDGWCGWVVWMGGVDGWCGWVVWMGGVDGWCGWNLEGGELGSLLRLWTGRFMETIDLKGVLRVGADILLSCQINPLMDKINFVKSCI